MPGDYPPSTVNKPKDTKPDMDTFRDEVSLYLSNFSEKQLGGPIHISELTEADALMWQNAEKYIKGSITKKELDFKGPYLNDVLDSGLSSRSYFYAVLANKINITWMTEEMKEIEETEKHNGQHKI